MSELTLRGHPGAPGAALGPAWTRNGQVERSDGTPAEHVAQVRRGLDLAASELAALAVVLRETGHAADAEIVLANELMASDPDLIDAAVAAARAGFAPTAAIAQAAEPHVQALATLDDPNLAARAADLRAIVRRAGELATGADVEPPLGAIILAHDLGPGEVAAWSGRIAAIALAEGGVTAHAAIVARSLGIPLVTGAGSALLQIPDGAALGVDADRGLVIRDPGASARARLEQRVALAGAEAQRDHAERHQPAVTTDGRSVRLLANAGTRAEVEAALAAGAEGIGLLRSELAFLEAGAWPTEDDHVAVLAPLLEPLAHRIATVRTLDFGGDKTPSFLAGEAGARNLLGARGIRLALDAPDAMGAQLRGILRAAGDCVLRILIPMVTDPGEMDEVRELVRAARAAVAPHAPEPQVGAMIEVPAAAINAHLIARHCDFLSIGTNDLVQYTLAVDREDPRVAGRAVAHHPAIVRLVSRVVAGAHAAGIPVDVCGEAAGDPEFLPLLIGMGVDELSVSPARLAQTRRLIRSLSREGARAAVAVALHASSPDEVAIAARSALSGE